MFDTEKLICEIEARPPLYDVKCKEYSNREVKAKCWFEVANTMFSDWESSELTAKEKDDRVKDLMRKWKSLRDFFMRDHRTTTAPGTGKAAGSKKWYVYYDQLQFLLPHLKGNQNTASNIARPNNEDNDVIAELDVEATVVENVINDSDHNDAQNVHDIIVSETSTSTFDPSKKANNKRKFENPKTAASKRSAIERSVAASAKDLTNILAANLEMQREDRQSDKNGHKAFLLSFLPVLDSMPFNESMLIRGEISQIFVPIIFVDKEPPA